MRAAGVMSLVLILTLAAGIALARAIGQARDRDAFPLPAADGCWQRVCFADLTFSEIQVALNVHPRVQPGSARFIDDIVPIGYAVPLAYRDARSDGEMRLYLGADYYVMNRTGAALLSLGDLFTLLGPPAALSPRDDYGNTTLYYPARGLTATVRPVQVGRWGMRLGRDDPVRFVEVRADGVVYLPEALSWRGFTTYPVLGDE